MLQNLREIFFLRKLWNILGFPRFSKKTKNNLLGREHPNQEDAERAEQTRPERVEDVADEVLAKALVPVAERLGPREPLGTPCHVAEFIRLS
jgi:hypothetical protein